MASSSGSPVMSWLARVSASSSTPSSSGRSHAAYVSSVIGCPFSTRCGGSGPTLERGPVPTRARGGGLVGALQELQQDPVRGLGGSDQLVGQHELAELVAVGGTGRSHREVAEPVRFGVGVGVEDAFAVPARPVAGAAQLVGVRLMHDVRPAVRRPAGVRRRWPTGEPVSYTHLRAHETDSYLVCRL